MRTSISGLLSAIKDRFIAAFRAKPVTLQIALVAGGLIALWVTVAWLKGGRSSARARQSAKQALAETSRDLEQIQKQLGETELRIMEQQALILERRAQNELDARKRAAKDELDRKRRLEEAERHKASAIAKANEDDAKQVAKVESEATARLARERESQRLKVQRQADEQAARAALAAESFSRINLRPRLLLSKTLKEANSRAEIRGQGYVELLQLSDQKEWLPFLNKIERGVYKEYPSATIINGAASTLQSSLYKVLCQTTLKERDGIGESMGDRHTVLMIKFAGGTQQAVRLEQPRQHPDGIGFSFEWKPKEGDCALFYSLAGKARDFVTSANRGFSKEYEALLEKNILGEIDDATLAARREEIRLRIRDSLFAWASEQ
jgi:hypothetical protein